MTSATGVRIGWTDLPRPVQAAVEEIIGDAVVEAVSQPGGFSPGTADRVRTATGRRAFVKAVCPELNEHTPAMHRREAYVTAALPELAPAPRLLGSHDDGHWIALVLEDVEGRHPATPWLPEELDAVLTTLAGMARLLTPAPVPALSPAADVLDHDFAGWRRIRADPPDDLDPWAAGHLDELCALADRGLAALAGDTLAHLDVRADNLLLGAKSAPSTDRTVTVVDWPWACHGPAWLDTLMLLFNVRLFGGGHDTEALLRRHTAANVDPVDLTAVLAGFGGFFLDTARLPPARGLPTVRAFQRAQAEVVLPWVRERLDPSS